MTTDSQTEPAEKQPFLVQFFDPHTQATDSRGRTLQDILQFTDDKLESSHDYIQFLFPLPEGSMFNWQSPVITKEVFDAFRSRNELREGLQQGYKRILSFYGFNASITGSTDVTVTRSADYKKRFGNWVTRMDHNHLRISRILRSLRVLGLDAHAQAFYEGILKVNDEFPNRIGSRSLVYWKRAAKRPLYLAPDVDDDDAVTGPKFLIEYEQQK